MPGITVYSDVVLSLRIVAAAGLRGRSSRKTERSQNQGGFSSVNMLWEHSLREYDLGFIPMLPAQWAGIEGLFEITSAGTFGFLMQDPKDGDVTASQGVMQPYSVALKVNVGAPGLGYGMPTYRLGKTYSFAGTSRTYTRRVSRPMSTAVATRNGTPLVIGAAPGNATFDVDTGTVTFVADASQAMASIATGATTVLTFATSVGIVAAMSVGERVFLSGVTGSAAAVLNGASHEITAKAGSTLTVNTVTTGLSGAAGTAYKYPQATDALGWSGGFYVPVHFASDDLNWNLMRSGNPNDRLTAGQGIVLQEIRE